MRFTFRWFSTLVAPLALLPGMSLAQQPAVVTGRVTDENARPIASATVTIPSLGLGATTRANGEYTILVPGARVQGQAVPLTARVIGYKPQSVQLTLREGTINQDFALASNPLQLGEIVVTGAGTASEVEKLGTARNYVDSSQIVNSHETNVVSALAAKAPNVAVVSSSGDPGSSSYIQVRGLTTIGQSGGEGQPLFVVDGVPIDNSTDYNNTAQQGLNGGTIFPPNNLLNMNPDDIENVEILKGAASGAIYGARAGQGVILFTTKK